ncbi:hypothetical protein DRN74_00175 [Candidatus Micrarchaeota archaeon]|nr:MAG: hypothetical protein DRN74_00175 [Candidatus Micrarchaeota archaeon]
MEPMASIAVIGIISRILGDINLAVTGFKIIVLLFVIQFIRSHFDAGPIPVLLTLIIGYIFLFQYWEIFGPIMLVYFFIIFGFVSVLLDIAIVKPWAGGGHVKKPDMTSKDMLERMRKYHG